MRLTSVQAGLPRVVVVDGREERTAIDKRPLAGPVRVAADGIVGDAVGDTDHHGGPDQALLCFSADHYALFESREGRRLPSGSFGENLTIAGLDEAAVRLGDVYRVGDVEFEVSAPRTPCRTLARHLDDRDLVPVIRSPHRAGWYARVLRPGETRAGDEVTLLRAGPPEWTVRRAAAVKADRNDAEGARALLGVPALAARWRASLLARVEARP